ncbi:MAG: WD40 repeat domain-containing protein, partial [Bacteroidota bacterium]
MNDNSVAIGLASGYIAVYNFRSDEQIGGVLKLAGAVYSLFYFENSNILVAGSAQGFLYAFNMQKRELLWSKNISSSVLTIAHENKKIFLGLNSGEIAVLNENGEFILRLPATEFPIRQLKVTKEDQLWFTSKGGVIYSLETEFFNEIQSFKLEKGRPTSIELLNDKNVLLSGCNLGLLRGWNLKNGEAVLEFQIHNGAIYGIQQHGQKLATFGFDKQLKIWSLQNFERLLHVTFERRV